MIATEPTVGNLLVVEDLRVGFGPTHARHEVVSGISFGVSSGKCLAIVGESGSGKSVTARALIGLAGPGSHTSASRLQLSGHDLRGMRDRQWRTIRGKEIGFILQDALVALDPLRRVGREVGEALRLHGYGTVKQRRRKVIEILHEVGIPDPEIRALQRPHELSGGLRQRALIASALALDPGLIIADEPTTSLDVTIQAQVLALLEQSKLAGAALILISHDLAVVGQLADDIAVMRDGSIIEQGRADDVLRRPFHAYTRMLLESVPSRIGKGVRLVSRDHKASAKPRLDVADRGAVLVEAVDLVKRYKGPGGTTRTVVEDVSLELRVGETLGLVGESGSGKTTVGRIVLALTAPDEGRVLLRGEPWSEVSEEDRRSRRQQMSVIYQDPLSSFDPRWTVARILMDALPGGSYRSRGSTRDRAMDLLDRVGLGREHLDRRPALLSGGQRQRVAIARALAPNPAVIVCDEPVSSLDISIQAQVLDLLADLQEQLGISYLFISHDLGVIRHVSDRVAVMKDGRVVEEGLAEDVFTSPRAEATRQLVQAVPVFDDEWWGSQ
jgi:peptide/nickel transport system ATP-binding protein